MVHSLVLPAAHGGSFLLLGRWALMALGLMAWWSAALAGGSGTVRMPSDGSRALAWASAEDTRARGASNEMWRGEARSALAERWYHWFEAIPFGVVPHGDPSGANCGIGQAGPVWFLSGPLGGTYALSCTIPAGKAIMSPVLNVIDDYPCPDPNFKPAPGQSLEDFLEADIARYVDPVAYATASFDNKPLRVYRVKTPLFGFTAAASNVAADTCITGSPQLGVTDGYYVFIDPPRVGQHVLQLRSGESIFGGPTEVTITLTVK